MSRPRTCLLAGLISCARDTLVEIHHRPNRHNAISDDNTLSLIGPMLIQLTFTFRLIQSSGKASFTCQLDLCVCVCVDR